MICSERYAKGLIALSACISGELPQLLLNGRREAARESVKKHLEIFGEGNYFIEIQDHGLAEEKQVLPELVALWLGKWACRSWPPTIAII